MCIRVRRLSLSRFLPLLCRRCAAYGFEKPSAIQQRAIIPIVKGRDLIAQSQSGTGKTAVFSIGILQVLDTTSPALQALVLSPTRELAEQTQKVMLALGDYMSVRVHACIGGKSVGEDIRRLEAGVHAVSGTPGRVFDMITVSRVCAEAVAAAAAAVQSTIRLGTAQYSIACLYRNRAHVVSPMCSCGVAAASC